MIQDLYQTGSTRCALMAPAIARIPLWGNANIDLPIDYIATRNDKSNRRDADDVKRVADVA